MREITSGDFLAGGGGVTEAMSNISGLRCRWVLNHDQQAIRTNFFNHNTVKHYWADLYRQDERVMEYVDFVWASIECTQHSRANGGRSKKIGSYTLGWELLRYLKYLRPRVIGIENVPEFRDWSPVDENNNPVIGKKGEEFSRWKNAICSLGYDYHERILNAADFGLPTRRVRYFAFFTKKELHMTINWPKPTHSKKGENGLAKWNPCGPHINLDDEGQSIFGRIHNPKIPKGVRRPLSPNTLKRIAGGIKKFHPEMQMVLQYYGNGFNGNSLKSPIHPLTTKDRHTLITVEKLQFIQDHCRGPIYDSLDNPMSPQLTWETKHFVTVNNPPKVSFLAPTYNSSGSPQSNLFGLDEPMWSISTREKFQFITAYFSSAGRQDTQNQSINSPLGTICTADNKKALVTLMNELTDFDIKMRFLYPEELSTISTFPKGYFTHPDLALNRKNQVKLIGNAVPPKWAQIIIEPVVKELQRIVNNQLNLI